MRKFKVFASKSDAHVSDDFKKDVENAICIVNDRDYMREYDTPESFGDAVLYELEGWYGEDLTDAETEYVKERVGYGDFSTY